jgi:hypothetical protein
MKLIILLVIFGQIFAGQVTILDQKFLPMLRIARELIFETGRPKNFDAMYRTNLRRGV